LVDIIKYRDRLKPKILLGFIIWSIGHIVIDLVMNDILYKSIWHFFIYIFMTWVVIKNYQMMKSEFIDSNLLESLKFSLTYQKVYKLIFNLQNIFLIIIVISYSLISLI